MRLVILGAFSVQDYVSKLTMSDSTNLFEVVFYLVNECLSIFFKEQIIIQCRQVDRLEIINSIHIIIVHQVHHDGAGRDIG